MRDMLRFYDFHLLDVLMFRFYWACTQLTPGHTF